MSKHTPGPWIIESTTIMNTWDLCGALECDGMHTYIGPICGEANARLIAAAPELLEACKAGLAYYLMHNDPDLLSQAFEKVIRKAEGGE